MKLKRFCEEYAVVAFPYISCARVDPNQVSVKKILDKISAGGWLIGRTKVFLKAVHRDQLLQRRQELADKVVHAQRFVRGFVARKKFARLLPVMVAEVCCACSVHICLFESSFLPYSRLP
jgi:hypothetical protein